MSGCDRELNAHFYSAASLKFHASDTWHDTKPSHIILTLGRPVLALPQVCSKRGAASTIFNDFSMLWPGIEPVTSRSPERTLYRLSYWGQYKIFSVLKPFWVAFGHFFPIKSGRGRSIGTGHVVLHVKLSIKSLKCGPNWLFSWF